MFEWETKCSKDKTQIGEWLDDGYSLVLVSVRDQGFSLDIDDWDACITKGFKPEWVEGYPGSDTPSGGKHFYAEPSPEQTHDLAKTLNVYNVRDDNKSGLILELKIEAASVAAPGARRFDQPRKVDGTYKPFNCDPYAGKKGIHPDLLNWIKTECYEGKPEKKEYTRCAIKWHSTWDEEHFADNEDITVHKHGMVNGAWHVVPDTCSVCGEPARKGTLRAATCKYIFGGNSFGYKCHRSGISSREEYEAKMDELYEDYTPWRDFIYESDDIDAQAIKVGFVIEDADEEPNEESTDTPTDQIPENGTLTVSTKPKPPPDELYVDPRQRLGQWTVYLGTKNEDGDENYEKHALVIQPYSEIAVEPLEWLWDGRIPKGKIALFGGLPGGGKSQVAIEIAACVSTGRDFPDGAKNTLPPSKVLLFTSEDDSADTIKPRLIAAGANTNLIYNPAIISINMKDKPSDRVLQLTEHLTYLKLILQQHPDIALIIFDPISSFFGDVNVNNDQDMRPVMDQLSAALQATKATVIGISHLNKKSDVGSIQKILGASSIPGVARAIWSFTKDTEDKNLRYMACAKLSLAETPKSLMFNIVSAEVEGTNGKKSKTSRIDWKGDCEEDADDLLKRERETSRDGQVGKRTAECMAWLMKMFAAKPGYRATELYKLADEAGYYKQLLWNARSELEKGGEFVIVNDDRGRGKDNGQWWILKPRTEPKMQPLELEEAM